MTGEPTGSRSDRGVLLVNLGSPDSTSVPDVRRYLDQFLMDERVLDTPWLIRRFIVSALILPRRPAATAEAYEKVWRPGGSPLMVISREVHRLLQAKVTFPVELGMRYGNPSIEAAIRGLVERGGPSMSEIFMIPLYPHYAMSSFETVVVEAERVVKKLGLKLALKTRPAFYEDPLYIEALAASARPYLDKGFDHLLFSYHGIPERHLRKSDPTHAHCLATPDCCSVASPAHATCYRAQVFRTTQLVVQKAAIPPSKYSVSFQSRLGRDPWLKPYTDFEFDRLAAQGVKRMLVICPAFVSDCLETLEEIGMRGREQFLAAGGEDLQLIPCMNDHPLWIEALSAWCNPRVPATS